VLNKLRDRHNISAVNSGRPTKVNVTMPPRAMFREELATVPGRDIARDLHDNQV
jgi:hypothetical protein